MGFCPPFVLDGGGAVGAESGLVKDHKSKSVIGRLDIIERLLGVIKRLLERLAKRREPAHFDYSLGLAVPKEEKGHTMLEITITNEEQVPVRLSPKTSTGKPAAVDGVPTWEIISGESTVTASEDGLSATLRSSDNPGDTEIMVKADADIGEGVTEISDIIRLTVAGAQAANLGLSAGQPVPKDANPAPTSARKK